MDIPDVDELETVADLFTGLAHPARIAVLYGLDQDVSMVDVAEEIEMSRGALQEHVERLIAADLVYRPSEDGTYALTPLGEGLLQLVEEHREVLVTAVRRVRDEEAVVREELSEMQAELGEIEDRTWERTIDTRTWERVWEEIEEDLEEL